MDPISRIDREIADRTRRLAIGLILEDDLQTLTGALIVAEGKGRYLRVIRAFSCKRKLPLVTSGILEKISRSRDPAAMELRAVQLDLAVAQSELVGQLQRHAGKYVDRLLFLALCDPGLWVAEDQLERISLPICDPTLLADATGISVVDSFASRDLVAGGSGRNLDALPAWILFADRSVTCASRDRILFSIHNHARAIFLPASDGLDIEVPDIQLATGPGLELLRRLLPDATIPCTPAWIHQQNTMGQFDASIANQIQSGDVSGIIGKIMHGSVCVADCVRSVIVHIAGEITAAINHRLPAAAGISELIVDCPTELAGTFINQLQRLWGHSGISADCFGSVKGGELSAVLTATLGMISVDQLPANLPAITGAHSQRILGRFTPGAPSNWRQLLREMADFQPPAMRLRDAL